MLQKKQSKNGKSFAVIHLEDLEGSCECMVFNKVYEEYSPFLMLNAPVFIEALVSVKDGAERPKLIVEKITPMNLVQSLYTEEIHVRMHEGSAKKEMLTDIRKLCKLHPGNTKLIFCLTTAGGEIAFIECAPEFNVSVNENLIRGITDIAGENKLHFKPDKSVPQPKKRPWEYKNNHAQDSSS
jgi:DNA polymerase-3 subunit alpha